jgi:hypothetical protein
MCSLPDTAVFLVTEHLRVHQLAFRTLSLHFSTRVGNICVGHFQAHIPPTSVLIDNNTLTVIGYFILSELSTMHAGGMKYFKPISA